jgi:hypothetical protein
MMVDVIDLTLDHIPNMYLYPAAMTMSSSKQQWVFLVADSPSNIGSIGSSEQSILMYDVPNQINCNAADKRHYFS